MLVVGQFEISLTVLTKLTHYPDSGRTVNLWLLAQILDVARLSHGVRLGGQPFSSVALSVTALCVYVIQYGFQYGGSDYFLERFAIERFAILRGNPYRIYSAIVKRDDVSTHTIGVHFVGSP